MLLHASALSEPNEPTVKTQLAGKLGRFQLWVVVKKTRESPLPARAGIFLLRFLLIHTGMTVLEFTPWPPFPEKVLHWQDSNGLSFRQLR